MKTWTKINQQKSFLEEQRQIKVKTWTKINQQNMFLEGHFKTIGKWVQKRQTLIFTVANFSVCQNEEVNFDFDGKTRRIFKRAFAVAGASTLLCGHALCVFLCTSSLMHNENPNGSATSVREKHWFYVVFAQRC